MYFKIPINTTIPTNPKYPIISNLIESIHESNTTSTSQNTTLDVKID